MKVYTIIVDFRLQQGARAAFRKLIDANARESVASEPGCRRFDVLEPEADADRIVLYEIYDDRAALDAHMATAHYKAFDKASASLVVTKDVAAFALVCEGSGTR